jgi:CRISPR/Cas system CMR subunit Cmr4 (Cas7 group RAMP superfamily)
MSGINLCPALGSEITSADKKAIIADNAALLAENQTLRESLIVEREKTAELITSYSEIISTDNAINAEKDKQIVILKDTIVAKDKAHATEMKKAEAKGWVRTILVGIAAGALGYLVAK